MVNICCQKGAKTQKEVAGLNRDTEILNDVNRLRILCLLKEHKELCVCDIYEALDLPQNLVSYHLGRLRKAGFVESKKDGVRIIYRQGRKKLNRFQFLLKKLLIK